jgi:hypothetical protein
VWLVDVSKKGDATTKWGQLAILADHLTACGQNRVSGSPLKTKYNPISRHCVEDRI